MEEVRTSSRILAKQKFWQGDCPMVLLFIPIKKHAYFPHGDAQGRAAQDTAHKALPALHTDSSTNSCFFSLPGSHFCFFLQTEITFLISTNSWNSFLNILCKISVSSLSIHSIYLSFYSSALVTSFSCSKTFRSSSTAFEMKLKCIFLALNVTIILTTTFPHIFYTLHSSHPSMDIYH